MSLPIVPLPSKTVEVGGQPVTFRSLSRAEALTVTQDFRGKPDEAEAYIIAHGCDVTIDEANAWRESTDPVEAGKVIDGILILSGLAKGEDEKDPN